MRLNNCFIKIAIIMLKREIINDSNSNKPKIFFGEAPTILSKAISCLLLFRFEYKIVIRPISDVKITIEDIDSIIFSVMILFAIISKEQFQVLLLEEAPIQNYLFLFVF